MATTIRDAFFLRFTAARSGLGRVSSQSVFGRTLAYQYDAASRRTRLTYPDSYFVNYGYTSADELSTLIDSMGEPLATFEYDGLGNRTGIGRPTDAAVTASSVDAISRLQSLQHGLSGTAFDTTVGFGYNPAGQIVSRDQSNDAAYTWTPAQPSGSVLSQVDGQNQLTQFNGAGTSEDANGNLRSGINPLTYTFDVESRLRQGSGSGNTVTLDYDPTGMLSRVTVNGAPTEYLYDGPNLLAQYSGSTLLRKFVHGPGLDEPLVWFEGTGTSNRKFLHADERGSVIAASDNTAVATLGVKYSPDGESGALASPFGFTGQVYIEALELYYYKARMYSPKAARFLSPDPIGYADGMNLYAYVSGDPINRVDPFGMNDLCFTNRGKASITVTFEDDSSDSGSRPYSSETCFAQAELVAFPGNTTPNSVGPPQDVPCNDGLVETGNSLAAAANELGTASSTFFAAGVPLYVAGLFSGNVPLAGSGLILSQFAGYFSLASNLAEISSGLAHGFGGAGFENAQRGTTKLATAFALFGGFRLGATPQAKAVEIVRDPVIAVGGLIDFASIVVPDQSAVMKACGAPK